MNDLKHQGTFLGHPKGLFVLFFTELWERFSYYGMRAILVLYVYSSLEDGGLGWSKKDALVLYGWYTMLVYVMSIPGGILADRILGQKKTVMLGGLLLVAGHSILAIEAPWAFFTGLTLIVLGVGGLKPNISTMVGGLYKQGDIRRDKGFTIFYIGINIGAFAASLVVGYIGETYGWHYGFGLAGIGMIIGQLVFVWGQRYLKGIGDFVKPVKIEGTNKKKPLTKIEKDRVIVLLISFLIVIVFWGAFEQAGGLMNIYAKEKVSRMIFGWEVPASWFQAANPFFIITFGTLVAGFWVWRRRKGKEVSSLFKMAVGTMIMGAGFLLMTSASLEAGSEAYGKAGMYWLIFAYMLHTIGELCASPVALSFITKLAPVKYASIMMGVYFAATGVGNKVAGLIGESAQGEPVKMELVAEKSSLSPYVADSVIAEDKDFSIRAAVVYKNNGDFELYQLDDSNNLKPFISLDAENKAHLTDILENTESKNPDGILYATMKFEKDPEAKKVKANIGDGKDYSGEMVIEEYQNKKEFRTFTFIAIFTIAFGLLLIVFLKKLKKLTHGAEDEETDFTKEHPEATHGEVLDE